jgi:hypothetical protein
VGAAVKAKIKRSDVGGTVATDRIANHRKESLKALFLGFLLPLVVSGLSQTQEKKPDLSLSETVYSNAVLGFRYKAPAGVRDETESRRTQIHARAGELHTQKALNLLLAMSSGADDAAPAWRSVTIETYPRSAFSDVDDNSAEAKMTAWVAGTNGPGTPRSVALGQCELGKLVHALHDRRSDNGRRGLHMEQHGK